MPISDASFKTFTAGSLIKAADVNTNFSVLTTKALNATGDTLTGNLACNAGVTIDGRDLSADLDQAVKTTSSPTFSALTVTNTLTATTLSGSLNASNLTGTVALARLSGITTTQMDSANISQFTNDAGYFAASSGNLVPASDGNVLGSASKKWALYASAADGASSAVSTLGLTSAGLAVATAGYTGTQVVQTNVGQFTYTFRAGILVSIAEFG